MPINLNISSLSSKFVDVRDSIPGDCYNWSWIRPLSQVNYLAIHHTAGPDTQTPVEIANFHINNNGWGGIGYHFLIGKNGVVYYVGDISTARANVANLNEQVIGICLVGNFTSGRIPTSEQFDSANKLCDFFINNYPDLLNVNSWEAVKGHKELPGQSTTCPGDNWSFWRGQITEGGSGIVFNSPISQPPTPTPTPTSVTDRGAQISELYRIVLGRDPDMGGLQTYTNSSKTIDEIMKSMVNSPEHREIVALAKQVPALKSQVDSLQTSIASINQQLITTSEALQEREREINDLKFRVITQPSYEQSQPPLLPPEPQADHTLTIVGALMNLYKFIFPPRSTN